MNTPVNESNRVFNKRVITSFVISFLIIGTISFLSIRSIQNFFKASEQRFATSKNIQSLNDLIITTQDMRMYYRSFLALGDTSLYKNAQQKAEEANSILNNIIHQNVEDIDVHQNINSLARLFGHQTARFENLVYRASSITDLEEKIRELEQINEIIFGFIDEVRKVKTRHEKLLSVRNQKLEAKFKNSLLITAIGSLVVIIILIFAISVINRDVKIIKRIDKDLQEKIVSLDATVTQLNKEINAREEAEKNLKRAYNDLKKKNEDLEQLAFLYSHDLQEPLRMVTSFSQLLNRKYSDKLNTEGKNLLNHLSEAAQRMQSLILDLLDYSMLDSHKLSLTNVDMNDIIKVIMARLSPLITETKAVIKSDRMLPAVQADENQLTQLFEHLIKNGIKFRKEEEKPLIIINAEESENNHITFSVQDNGIGFNEEFSDKIFKVFQRLHPRELYPGTGIGLAICKKIVERHGGKIWVESVPEKGSTFYFTLKKAE